jgi:hypothetical protein
MGDPSADAETTNLAHQIEVSGAVHAGRYFYHELADWQKGSCGNSSDP